MNKIQLKVLESTFIRRDKRGVFVEILNKGIWKNISFGKMKKGAILGDHYHKKTDLFLFIINGRAQIDMVDIKSKKVETMVLKNNQGAFIKRGYFHKVKFLTDSIFIMSKSEKYNPKNPDTYNFFFKEPEPEKRSKTSNKS